MAKKTQRPIAPRAAPRLTKQQAARQARERRQRRVTYSLIIGTTLAVALLLGGGLFYDRTILPGQTVLTVNGESVDREMYWAFRRYELGRQMQQIQFQAQMGQGADFARQRLESLQADMRNVRSAPPDPPTLERMATNLVVKQRAEQLGVQVTEEDVQAAIQRDFAPPPATPTPVSPAEATQTAVAATAIATLTPAPTAPGTAATGGTPGAAAATPTTGPTGTPTPYYTPTPTLTPTPMSDEARATAMITFRDEMSALRQAYSMTAEQYREWIVLPQLLETRIRESFSDEIADVQPQTHAAHILVQSEEQAREALARLAGGADFAEVAREMSTDPGSAQNGGDLGWFPRGVMTAAFEQVAFELEPGAISEPVQSEFGWHVIKVLERDESRLVEPQTLSQLRENRYQKWLTEQRESSTVTAAVPLPSFAPTPTPAPAETPAP